MTTQYAEDQATTFTLENDSIVTAGESAHSDFLAAEMKVIGNRLQTIAQKLKHDGPVKMLHRDQSSVIAAQLGESTHGVYLTSPSATDGEILSSL